MERPRAVIWSVGVTTVPARMGDLLPRTLASLDGAGFPPPRLFVDGHGISRGGEVLTSRVPYCELVKAYEQTFPGYDLTVRYPALRPHGNWFLALHELYIRQPKADWFLVCQDDFVTYRGLREYLEKRPVPEKGYGNLYTFTNTNEPVIRGKPPGWYEAGLLNSGPPEKRLQAGRGAVALLFSKAAMLALLSSAEMVNRPDDANRGWRKVDGGVVNAMNALGYREHIHNPSLTQHCGQNSTMGSLPQKYAETFRGETFDIRGLLTC